MKPRTELYVNKWDIEPFWARVDRKGPDECWLWLGKMRGDKKYGTVRLQGSTWMVHRIAYHIAVGPVPDGMTLDHVWARGCRSKLCCNPAHLEPVTQSVNVKRHFSRPDRLYPLVCKKAGHPKEFGRSNCRKCNVIAVAKCVAAKPEKYRQLAREGIRRRASLAATP